MATKPSDPKLLQLALDVCELAQRAADLVGYREGVLDMLYGIVRFDVGLFHEFSPRTPLTRAAIRGIEPDTIAAGLGEWDDNAVMFERLRELALKQGGVASAEEAFARDARARTAWRERVCKPLRAQRVVIAHAVVSERIVSAILLCRSRAREFTELEQNVLRTILPAIAVGDALQQRLTDETPGGLPTQLRCLDQRLTSRQREIVERVALGHTNGQIGEALGLSVHTVRNLLTETRRRVGAANRAELVRLAVLR
jgi:DNA-binding CsgD family transcriptional regulator